MTVDIFYFVYGVWVERSNYMKIMGYTKENWIKQFDRTPTNTDLDLTNDELIQKHIDEWFVDEHLNEHYCGGGCHKFVLNGFEYIARELTHDCNDGGDFIVGLDMGDVNVDGEINMRTPNTKNISPLLEDEEWSQIFADDEPKVRIATDDCWCCC